MDTTAILMMLFPLSLCLWFFIDAIKETKKGRGDEYADGGPYINTIWDPKNKHNIFIYGFMVIVFLGLLIIGLSK
tara:strand:+ start:304 stop:528 length:225 start_codon:yes stop_codon:yes gene_type:complete